MSRVLTIGDPHEPVAHPGYLSFCQDLYYEWDCDTVVILGDITDNHAISFHAAHPECPGPATEADLTLLKIQKWYQAFPNAKVCIGNHDERPGRLVESVKIPQRKFLRSYSELWETPKWDWQFDHIIDNVYYFHGTARGGIHPAWNTMKDMLMSVVMGHLHSCAGVKWLANPLQRTFAMDVGCGIDIDAFQFAYGKHIKKRPILAAGVVLDGVPYHEIMPCGVGEKYHKSKFGRKKKC